MIEDVKRQHGGQVKHFPHCGTSPGLPASVYVAMCMVQRCGIANVDACLKAEVAIDEVLSLKSLRGVSVDACCHGEVIPYSI
jgi:hypothetical protein